MKKILLFLVFFVVLSVESFGQQCPDFQEIRHDVYIARDTNGWYVNIGTNSTNQFAVARCFYQRYPERDYYDFLWVDQTSYNPQDTHTFTIATRSAGIVPLRYDDSWMYGSKGRLTAISWAKREFSDPIGRHYSGSANNHAWNTLNHELTHHVCCYYDQSRTGASDLFPSASASVRMVNGHLSPWLGTISDLKTESQIEGLMEDLPYTIDGLGKAIYQVPRQERLHKPSPFTAYTLGWVLPSEILGKFPVIQNIVWDSQNAQIKGNVKRWAGIDELISLQWGKRWPEATFSQRHFRVASVLLIDMHDTETLRTGIDKWVNQFIESTAKISEKWYEAMSGRSTLNDKQFKIPSLRVGKTKFEPGKILSIRLSGADSDTKATFLAFDGANEYRLAMKTNISGIWEFTATMGLEHVAKWSAIVYFGPDRETGGITHTTSNILFFEVASSQKK